MLSEHAGHSYRATRFVLRCRRKLFFFVLKRIQERLDICPHVRDPLLLSRGSSMTMVFRLRCASDPNVTDTSVCRLVSRFIEADSEKIC